MKERFDCPYCGYKKSEYIDLVDSDVNYKGGYNIEIHKCKRCNVEFYVEKVIGVIRIEIRKEKY